MSRRTKIKIEMDRRENLRISSLMWHNLSPVFRGPAATPSMRLAAQMLDDAIRETGADRMPTFRAGIQTKGGA